MCNFQNEPDEITFALHEIQELNDVDSDELEQSHGPSQLPAASGPWTVDDVHAAAGAGLQAGVFNPKPGRMCLLKL